MGTAMLDIYMQRQQCDDQTFFVVVEATVQMKAARVSTLRNALLNGTRTDVPSPKVE